MLCLLFLLFFWPFLFFAPFFFLPVGTRLLTWYGHECRNMSMVFTCKNHVAACNMDMNKTMALASACYDLEHDEDLLDACCGLGSA